MCHLCMYVSMSDWGVWVDTMAQRHTLLHDCNQDDAYPFLSLSTPPNHLSHSLVSYLSSLRPSSSCEISFGNATSLQSLKRKSRSGSTSIMAADMTTKTRYDNEYVFLSCLFPCFLLPPSSLLLLPSIFPSHFHPPSVVYACCLCAPRSVATFH